MRGIDISNWQRGLKLANLNSSIEAVIVKATGGNAYCDPSFETFANEALKNNKLFGFYHFARDGHNSQSGKAEADFFYSKTKQYFGKGIPVLDLEDNGLKDWDVYTYNFINRIHELVGIYPIIYTGLEGIRRCKAIPDIFKKSPIWFAGYPLGYINYWLKDETSPRDYYTIDPIANICMWQFTSAITMQGFNVDSNLIYMTKNQWLNYQKGLIMSDDIGYKVWAYRNNRLEPKRDAYAILREISSKVTSIDKRLTALEKKIK